MTSSDPALDVRAQRTRDVGAAPVDEPDADPGTEEVGGADRPDHEPGRRRRRVSKWDRPPPPKDWRWWVSNLGKTLIAAGLLMFAFVAYQLWGTGIETARAQRALEDDFETLLTETPPVTDDPVDAAPPSTTASEGRVAERAPAAPADGTDGGTDGPTRAESGSGRRAADEEAVPVPVDAQNLPEIVEGDALARLEIPRIGADHIVVAGVSTEDLRKGPGHYPDTPLPGQQGNAAIAGHRTTYGQPFYDIDVLEPGDEMVVTTPAGRFVYVVTGQQIVAPSDYEVVATVDPTAANLTLTSCHPRFTARERIVVSGELDVERSSPVGEAIIDYGRGPDTGADTDTGTTSADRAQNQPADSVAAGADGPTARDGEDGEGGATAGRDPDPASGTGDATGADPEAPADARPSVAAAPITAGAVADTELADAFADGWFSDPGAPPQVALWGLVVALIGVGASLLSRTTRRDWVGGLVGLVPFVVALYFFFQNVNRLLPPNL